MPEACKSSDIAMFQCLLIGTWQNVKDLSHGGRPLSYNVMPLPQVDDQTTRPPDGTLKYGGFILKNFSFVETIRFNGSAKKNDDKHHQDPEALAVVAGAPNRGGSYTQFAHAVFYDQQVRFAEGPAAGKIVHVENGAWLHLGTRPQLIGPYGPDIADRPVLRQPPYITIAKQIAVPHGNTVLALGSVDLFDRDHFKSDLSGLDANTIIPGAPVIPDAPVPYPQLAGTKNMPAADPAGIAIDPYTDPYARKLNNTNDFENPNEKWTLNPNFPLQEAIKKIEPTAHIHWSVTTSPLFGGDASVTNIPFENKKSKVTEYWADYWLLSTDKKYKCYWEAKDFDYLAYSQTILMEMDISLNDGKTYDRYVFPHVTTNTVKKVAGTPTEARDKTSRTARGRRGRDGKGRRRR